MHAGIFLGIHVASTWLGNALTLEKSESVHRSSGNNRRKNRAKLSGQFLSVMLLGQVGFHVPRLMDLATLNNRVLAESAFDGGREGLGAVQDE